MSTKRPKRAFALPKIRTGTSLWIWSFWAVALLGVAVRAVYAVMTPYDVRSHDVEGHVEYIEYVANTFRIPHATGGWEFYQPPLYYFIIGTFYKFWSIFDVSTSELMKFIQFDSLLISLGTLAAGMWIARLVFRSARERTELLLYSLLMATFPGLIYISARINNDVLYTFFAFLFLAVLVEWWQDKRRKHWYVLQLVIAAGVLTKSNSLLFLPIAYLCLLIYPEWKWRRKFLHGFLGLVMLAVVSGWYPVYRYAIETLPYNPVEITGSTSATLIPNLTNLHSGLRLKNIWQGYVVFNPVKVIRIPYNNTWEDASRREYFWEYLLRSSISGEFSMGEQLKWATSQLLLLSCVLLAVGVFGFFRSMFRWKDTAPFLITLLLVIAGHLALRFSSPYSAIQDFRYSPLLLPTVGYFAIYAQRFLPALLQRILIYVWGVFFFLATMYVLSIVAYGIR